MNDYYILKQDVSQALQSDIEDSFIGGMPRIPPNEIIPRCKLCGVEESFFFQVAMPKKNIWEGLSLAVFACTSCANANHLIPQMLLGPLGAVKIPEGFLESYQINFRFLVFETKSAIKRKDYQEKIKFKRLCMEKIVDLNLDKNKIGGNPNWLLEDESPESYNDQTSMFFLLQILQGFQFEIIKSAPKQIELGLSGFPEPSPLNYYQLFNGNKIFLFGTENRTKPLVYAITQVD
jgi:hypothetical protein